MKKVYIIIFLCVIFSSQVCFGNFTNMNENYYIYELEPKLDILCGMAMNVASEIVRKQKPSFETELTQEERYFSSDNMEFFTGTSGIPAQYSGVKKLAVWVHGLTIITGWTLDGVNYHINYVYTTDATFVLPNGIKARTFVSELEKFFNGSLYDISAENGVIGHVQAVLANDDWSKPCVLINYSGRTIDSIEAWDNNVYGDVVPIVPNSERISNYISTKKREMHENELAFERELSALHNQRLVHSTAVSEPVKQNARRNIGAVDIVILSFSIGVATSVIIVKWLYRKLSKPEMPNKTNDNEKEAEYEAEYIDAEFTEETPNEEFDYPYEDIGEVIGR